MHKSILYPATILPFLVTERHKEEPFVLSVFAEVTKNPPDHYLVSSKIPNYQEIKAAVEKAKDEKKAIKVNYIKRGGKRFINSLA